jgi:hypothetical protein
MPLPGHPYSAAELDEKHRQDAIDSARRYREEQEAKARWLTAQKVADKAKAARAWIYDPATKTWYTPEEFTEAFARSYADHPLFYRVKIKNPVEGLQAGYKQLENLQARLLEFSKKVIGYLNG